MNTQLLTAVITGIIGAVIAPLVTQVIVPLIRRWHKLNGEGGASASKPKRKRKGQTRKLLPVGIGGVVGIVLGYFLLSPIIVSTCPPFAPTKVNITSPAADSAVPRLVTVQGTSCHIPNGTDLWLPVVPEGETGYYPQTGPIVVADGSAWSVSAYIGSNDPVDIGRGFVLIAALSDKQGSTAIRTYFAQPGPEFKSLEPLPQGIQLMAQVRVNRK